ncbi:MAG: hypothetical protein QM504_01570, partial [Pseudomonadota bacterium]
MRKLKDNELAFKLSIKCYEGISNLNKHCKLSCAIDDLMVVFNDTIDVSGIDIGCHDYFGGGFNLKDIGDMFLPVSLEFRDHYFRFHFFTPHSVFILYVSNGMSYIDYHCEGLFDSRKLI